MGSPGCMVVPISFEFNYSQVLRQIKATNLLFYPGTLVSSTNISYCHNIAEILLKIKIILIPDYQNSFLGNFIAFYFRQYFSHLAFIKGKSMT